ncbi:MAG: hypothetical protein DRZ76_00780, partial [Candidatus Nealsonbacteria bacterium]
MEDIQVPEILPILPMADLILFPGFPEIIMVTHESSKKLLRFVIEGEINLLGMVARKPQQEETFFEIGTVAEITNIKFLEYSLFGKRYTTVGLRGITRFR